MLTQESLISQPAELIRIATLERRLLQILQLTAKPGFCRDRPAGRGCGREVFFLKAADGTRVLDPDGAPHRSTCPWTPGRDAR